MALALRLAGVPFEGVEAGDRVGGLWNIDNPGSAIYESAHFISSSARSGWADFPMPEHYPDYPRWWEIRDYIHAWAGHHDLARHYEFGIEVASATPVADPGDGDDQNVDEQSVDEQWDVVLSNGEQRRYRGIVACPGFQRVPQIPVYPGTFGGQARHSGTYKRADEFRGLRVLVVGAGNSAVDIAVDAAVAADRAVISTRRGYWFFPKHIGGVPLDHFAINTVSSQKRLQRFLDIHVGDPADVGFGRPDHPPLAHHPILNDQVLHHLSHGDLIARPEIDWFEGKTVYFVDGSSEEIDLIIWATGFEDRVPFIAEEHCRASSDDAENDLFIWTFHRRHPHLVVLGPANLAAGGYWSLSMAADLIANHIRDETTRPDRWVRFRRRIQGPEPDLSGGYDYYQKPGHLNYVNAAALDVFGAELSDEFGFEPLTVPKDFEPPGLIDIDSWLDEPGPLRRPSHGSLTPRTYDPVAMAANPEEASGDEPRFREGGSR